MTDEPSRRSSHPEDEAESDTRTVHESFSHFRRTSPSGDVLEGATFTHDEVVIDAEKDALQAVSPAVASAPQVASPAVASAPQVASSPASSGGHDAQPVPAAPGLSSGPAPGSTTGSYPAAGASAGAPTVADTLDKTLLEMQIDAAVAAAKNRADALSSVPAVGTTPGKVGLVEQASAKLTAADTAVAKVEDDIKKATAEIKRLRGILAGDGTDAQNQAAAKLLNTAMMDARAKTANLQVKKSRQEAAEQLLANLIERRRSANAEASELASAKKSIDAAVDRRLKLAEQLNQGWVASALAAEKIGVKGLEVAIADRRNEVLNRSAGLTALPNWLWTLAQDRYTALAQTPTRPSPTTGLSVTSVAEALRRVDEAERASVEAQQSVRQRIAAIKSATLVAVLPNLGTTKEAFDSQVEKLGNAGKFETSPPVELSTKDLEIVGKLTADQWGRLFEQLDIEARLASLKSEVRGERAALYGALTASGDWIGGRATKIDEAAKADGALLTATPVPDNNAYVTAAVFPYGLKEAR